MKRFLPILLVLCLLLTAIPLAGCFDSEEETALDTTTPLQKLESRVGDLEKVVNSLKSASSGGATKADVDKLAGEINSLKAAVKASSDSATSQYNSLVSRVAELEKVKEEEVAEAEEYTRWYLDAEIVTDVPDYIVIYVDDIDPRKIQEEGLYEIEVLIGNTDNSTTWSMGVLELEIVLRPKEYSPINQSATYLDSDKAPWLDWDDDFIVKTREGEKVCRRVIFTSDRYDFKHTIEPLGYYQLDLVLELYYD